MANWANFSESQHSNFTLHFVNHFYFFDTYISQVTTRHPSIDESWH
jgi:hypothetical protein